MPVEGDKEGRVYVNQAKFEQGHVHFPKGAAFLPALETELLTFPQGKADDQVDSISQALSFKRPTYDPSAFNANYSKLIQGIAARTW